MVEYKSPLLNCAAIFAIKSLNSGDSYLDGQQLLTSNLQDGVDKYMIPMLHRSQSYHHSILINIPLQIMVA